MKNEFEISFEKFQSAYQRLKEVVDMKPVTEILRDSTIQRFEFTFEACWKALRCYYKVKGKDVRYPRDAFKEAFNDGVIEDEVLFLAILDDRNKTTHIYSQEDVKKIHTRIVNQYADAFGVVLKKLEKSDLI